ncbi:MAG: methyltransferase domain-containing protein [candidate division Zixibacteria bacterium]|nr:methyltransferase domain-containing protein [candidate division Zixibacteria bacterium]
MLAAYPGSEILDVGGGHGQTTTALVRTGHMVTVLGSSHICKTRIEHLLDENHCTFKVGNIHDLPYPDQAFDVVISYRVLAHIKGWKRFLSEITRVARFAVVVDFPAICSVNFLAPFLFPVKSRIEGNARPYTSYQEHKLVEEFEGLGFYMTERFPEFFFPMVFHRVINSWRFSSTVEKTCRRVGLTNRFGSPVIIKLIRGDG